MTSGGCFSVRECIRIIIIKHLKLRPPSSSHCTQLFQGTLRCPQTSRDASCMSQLCSGASSQVEMPEAAHLQGTQRHPACARRAPCQVSLIPTNNGGKTQQAHHVRPAGLYNDTHHFLMCQTFQILHDNDFHLQAKL